MSSVTPAKGATKKEKKKSIPVKTSLNNPYDICWQTLEKRHKQLILKTLKDKISEVGLQKNRVNSFREWGNRRRSRKNTTPKPTEDQKPASEPTETQETPSKPTEHGWSNPAVRKQLAIGINEVTKGLERNELSLVLVCDSVKPAHMTSHLIPLSKTRSVPACQVAGLSDSLLGLLGLKSVLALGVKRGSEEFEDVVRKITPVVPTLSVAWIGTDSTPKTEKEHADTEKRQKRKLEMSSDEACDASPVILQPLKVKKIIPNPNKIRKPKKKKGKQS